MLHAAFRDYMYIQPYNYNFEYMYVIIQELTGFRYGSMLVVR